MSDSSPLLTHADLDTKKRKLDATRAALKTEFFGIDRNIDAIMDSIQTWYLLPSIITRPPIVALWSLTGCGKTALVRSLIAHLGMTTTFVEVQMDGFSSGDRNEAKTISEVLTTSGIGENQQGIILLDEFQRFRTVSDKGEDIKLERYQDVWMLLSDGRFPTDFSKLSTLIDYMDASDFYADQEEQSAAEREAEIDAGSRKKEVTVKVKRQRRFFITPHEAAEMKSMLRLSDTVKEIMTWPKDKMRSTVEAFLKANVNRPYDYTKCLVFVAGNLDEAFQMAGDVEDCDTSADVFHQHTLKIGAPEIKAALNERFRPEQIARLGNNHIVYPSLPGHAYMSLIKRTCLQYVEQARQVCNIAFTIEPSVYQEIYDNAVYPAQGTRPVFTSIHKLFGSPLSDAILWGLEHELKAITIGLDIGESSLVFSSGDKQKRVKIDFDIRARRKSRSADFNALVAVHEAGHAVVYAHLFKRAPIEVAANLASFKGGYNLFQSTFQCKEELLNSIAVSMAGIAAEQAIFGEDMRSTGCASDVNKATGAASSYVRRYAMGDYQGYVLASMDSSCIEDVEASDEAVHAIVKEQRRVSQAIITQYRDLLIALSNELVKSPKMDGAAFVAFVGNRIPGLVVGDDKDVTRDYAARLANPPKVVEVPF